MCVFVCVVPGCVCVCTCECMRVCVGLGVDVLCGWVCVLGCGICI